MTLMAEIPADGRDHILRLRDGRHLCSRLYGAEGPAAPAVFALHGTPGSRLKFVSTDEPAKALGLRVIAPDRWGYGLSDVPENPSLRLYAEDLAQLATALGLARFAVLGVSGGGPYAAAVAALLGAKVTALALVSPVGQIAGQASAHDMSRFHQFCFLKLPHLPGIIDHVFRMFRFGLNHSPDVAMKLAMLRAARADRQLMNIDKVRQRLSATFIEGLKPGAQGPVIDLQLFGNKWDVPLAAICAPARLWIGTEDQNVPFNAALALGRQVPGCALTELAGAGHLWVAVHYDEVLDWLAETLDLQPVRIMDGLTDGSADGASDDHLYRPRERN